MGGIESGMYFEDVDPREECAGPLSYQILDDIYHSIEHFMLNPTQNGISIGRGLHFYFRHNY